MTPLKTQFYILGLTVALGIAMGVIFDFYRAIRSLRKWRRVWVHFADLFVWLLFTVIVFAVLLFSNWGEVRVYIFLGLGLGILIHFRLTSRIVFKGFKLILEALIKGWVFLVRGVKWLFRVLVYPIALLIRVLGFPFQLLHRMFSWARKPVSGFCGRSSHKIWGIIPKIWTCLTRKKK